MNSIISSENLLDTHEDFPIDTDLTVKPTTCYMCTYDCPTDAYINGDGRIVKVEGQLCRRGRHQTEFQYHPDRLLYPLLRDNGRLHRITWMKPWIILRIN